MPPDPRITPEQALIRLYQAAAKRLRQQVRAALERGATGTAAWRKAQLDGIHRELRALGQRIRPLTTGVAFEGYARGAIAVDTAAGTAEAAFSFTGTNRRAAGILAHNFGVRIGDATTFVGRRMDDAFRRAALEEVGAGVAAGAERRLVSAALQDRLIREGVTDALTGFIDSAGRRWQLEVYTEMVARTTTREAVSAGTAARMRENGLDVITISEHGTSCEICQAYEGNTYSLDGTTPGLDVIDQLPPFHPNCMHVATPGDGSVDEFLNALENTPTDQLDEALAGHGPSRVASPRAELPPGFAPPPFSDNAIAQSTAASAGRLQRQEAAYAFGDPGPEAGAQAAREAWHEAQAKTATKAARAEARAADRAIDDALGPDLVAALDDFARSGVKWARDRDLRQALIDGELSIEDVTEMAERELAGLEGRRHHRQQIGEGRGLEQRQIPCFVCGRFKRRPADVCDHCGDDPVTHGGSAQEFNRAYGYSH